MTNNLLAPDQVQCIGVAVALIVHLRTCVMKIEHVQVNSPNVDIRFFPTIRDCS